MIQEMGIAAAPSVSASREFLSQRAAFSSGIRCSALSVFFLVLGGSYVGLGALAHDFGLSIWWLTAATMVIWAAPAQLILTSTLTTGAAFVEIAIAVSVSAVRLLPMVIAVLPLLKPGLKRKRDHLIVTHFTSASIWIEAERLLPKIASNFRLSFYYGLSTGYMMTAVAFGLVGFFLAAELPPIFAAGLLFLTPMSFLTSMARNCRAIVDILAFVFGIVLGPILAHYKVGLDLLWTGIIGGLLAYALHRLRARFL